MRLFEHTAVSTASNKPQFRPANHERAKVIYWFLCITLVLLYLAWPLTHLEVHKWTNDEGLYMQRAALANAGYPLYTETYLNKPPLLVWVLQLAFRIAGQSLAVARLAALCLTLPGFIAVGVIARRLWGRWASPAAMGVLLALAEVPERANIVMPDLPAMSFALVAIGAALLFRCGGRRGWMALSGAAFAGSLLIHPLLIYMALPLAMILFLPGIDLQTDKTVQRTRCFDVIVFLGAAAGAGLLTLAAVDRRAFFEWVLWYNYEAGSGLLQPCENWEQIASYFGSILPLMGLSMISLVAMGTVARRRRGLSVIVTWWIVTVAILLASSPLWKQYLIFLVYPLVILIGGGLVTIGRWIIGKCKGEQSLAWWQTALVVMTLAGLVLFVVNRWERTKPYLVSGPKWSSDRRAAVAFLEDKVSPDGFVISDDPFLVFVAGRLVPPSLMELSTKQIKLGTMTTEDAIESTLRYRGQAVLFGTGRLERLPGFENWVASAATDRHDFSQERGIRIYQLALQHSDTHAAIAQFENGIKLYGYTLSSGEAHSGDVLTVMLFWQSGEAVPADYHVFVHLVTEEGYLYGQHDGALKMGKRHTTQWAAGQRVFDTHPIEIGQDVPPGRYHLFVGMYGWPSLERLPASLPDGSRWPDDQVLLGDVLIVLP
jgi:4-amino-4-deoxy-L-arabinose transferase-like glycosyltransferase